MIVSIILGTIFIAIIILVILTYSGLFFSIKVNVGTPDLLEEGVLVYKLYIQNYKTIGEAFRELKKFPVKQKNSCMGIYYDNPDVVDPESTRSAVGMYFTGKEVDECHELTKTMQGVGYSVIKLPKMQRAIMTKFPYRTLLSIPIAMSRVYDKLMKFIKEERLKVRCIMEYYPHDGYIHFIAPLDNHDAYIVEECLNDPPRLIFE